jgi:hypothetical protein
VAVGVPLFFFLVFERWFLVPLPKGPLEGCWGSRRSGTMEELGNLAQGFSSR